ncbi:hypothetical protein [Streptomyces sp. NBC_01669]|uniref:hypothetical protein n=1 Tax=Streptomyces sp. NBC_01669 TaxID=2975909 RepID=UPI002256FA28|nr:hypothetical protein [Streptomyces sp. NBC_01669]MCX4533841.1 hypothetical protein [Streptomyces sp. NBC_01669]
MGLMSWLRGRRAEEAGDAGLPVGAVQRERFDPSRLPPLQRTVSGQDLVIDPGGFQGALTTRRDTALGIPLGHLISPEAPSGLVHGITSTSAAPVGGPSAVQRAMEMPPRSGPLSRSLPVAVQRASYGGEGPVLTTAGATAVADLPVRQLIGEQPLVTDTATVSASASTPGSAHGPASAPGVVPAVQRTDVPRPAAERPRRVPGLGAPMSGLPPTAQREAAAAAAGTGSDPVPVSRSAEGTGPEEVKRGPEEGTAPLLGDDPLVASPPETAAPQEQAGSSAEPVTPTPAPVQRTALAPVQRTASAPANVPTTPSLPVAPLLADRPLPIQAARTETGLRGATATAAPVQRSPEEAVSPVVVPVRWVPAASRATGNGTGTGTVQRTAVPLREALGPVPVPAPSPLPPPPPAVQRQSVSGPPAPRSRNPVVPAIPSAGSVAVAAGVAQRMADGSVVFGTAPTGISQPVVQRETETSEPPPPPPDPEPDPDPESEAGPATEPGGEGTGAGSSPVPGSVGHTGQGGPPVTDELVRALYGPLSRLLKADLRLERERAGFLIRTRH